MSHGNYKDKNLVKGACEAILKVVRPGDVINQVDKYYWYELWLQAGCWGIQTYQKKLFGKASNWYDTHTMLFFDQWDTFSVEIPKATVKPLQEYCLSDMSIYRCKLVEMKPEYVETMMDAADKMISTDYDIGQLLDIALREILDYPQDRPLKLFDFGKKKKVCSVGVRVCYEYLYMQKIKPSLNKTPQGKWLFHSAKQSKWPAKFVENYKGTDVEATSPAHFANTDYFQNEFELVAKFDNGKRIG